MTEPHDTTYTLFGQQRTAPRPEPGLYVVATPIGNLGDVTLRALDLIAGADRLACEDTRITAKLLQRFRIDRRMTAYHEHSSDDAAGALVAVVASGGSVALVSDAGTPLLSDPGYKLVNAALEAGLPVIPIPGPSALLAALAVCGLPTDAFFFAGFLPSKQKARADRLMELQRVPGTLLFYEAPHRIADSLTAMAEAFGPRAAVVCRELTKLHETVYRGPLDRLASEFSTMDNVRGEIVVCVAPPSSEEAPDADDADRILTGLLEEMKPAKAAQEAARLTGLARRDLYQRALELKGKG